MIVFDDNLEGLKRQMNPEFLKKAEKSAIKAVQRKTATRISKRVREKFNVTARAIADRLKLKLQKDDTEAYLWYIGSRIGLINFSGQFKKVRTSRGVRQGATAKVTKSSSRFLAPGGFIAEGRNQNVHIFQRMKKGQSARLPIRKMTGPAIPQMVEWPAVHDDAVEFVGKEYPKELTNKLDYFLERQMGK